MGIEKLFFPSRFHFIRRSSSRTSEDSTAQESSADGAEDISTPDHEDAQGEDGNNSQDELPRQDSLPIVAESPQEETDEPVFTSPSAATPESSSATDIPNRVASPVEIPENPEDILKRLQETLQNMIDDKLANIPLRLIDAHTGILYTSNDLDEIFKESEEYKRITESLISTPVDELHHTINEFFKYAMLSHKWASAKDEPQYWQIEGSVHEMGTPLEIRKLQQFCTISKESGYRWAWSDTCCIDKSNNAELQESIISMFSWYRESAITIVYLADVSDISQLKNSQWFKRGWTLQELLAPRFIRFYKQDWQPLIDSDGNHKDELLTILHEITHIEIDILKEFRPGVDNVKKRLSWVGNRTTKKIEDVAYCLMGIFGIHMPVMYGEKHHAFVRLQKEIMALTEDLSLFDWVGEPSALHSYFASHPRCFMTPHEDARQDSTSSKFEFRLLKTSMGFTTGLSSTAFKAIKDLFKDPPPGHFIANGKMSMPLFVHEVSTVSQNPNKPGLFSYLVKAEGLSELEVTTTQVLVPVSAKDTVRYRIVRMWEVSLIPREGTISLASDSPATESPDSPEIPAMEGCPKQEKEKDKEKDKDKETWVGRLSDRVSHTTAAAFLRRLQEPFIAQLLFSPGDKQPWRRIGTTTRIVAHASSGSLNFRGIKTLLVH
ncbi:hypothetical protein AZE42_10098 [Rhizopogon vesiculosus]|uniref:Heterokaryon incompatibility domain-containing protein n=1 Tax=Rhizopogon vesiculosus TaxID=180088 RepID=A0A1J8R422_9AGAM|nr:hypothetical protein AZE42_10098 [Rhizopogon vesiculosus]